MAKVYDDGIFGISAESGMYAQSLDFDFSMGTVFIPDETGNDVAGAFFNEEGTFSLNGYRTTGGLPAKLGAAIALANAPTVTDFLETGGGETIVTGGKAGVKNREFQTVDLSGVYKPFLGELQPA